MALENMPETLKRLLEAQKNFDSKAYASNFSPDAIVVDEGETYKGQEQIQAWNSATSAKYQTVYKPLDYDSENNILTVEVSGTFPGSPIILHQQYQFDQDDLILSWKVVE